MIALTNEARGLVDKFVADTSAKHPIVIEGTDSASTYQIKGFPTTYLIGADGKVIAEGMPNEQMIEEALRYVRLVPKLAPAKLAPIQKLLDARKLAEARAALVKARDAGSEEEKAAATEAIDWIDESGKLALQGAGEMVTSGDFAGAAAEYRRVGEQHKGTEHGDAAAKALKDLLADPARKREVDAADAFEKLREKISDMKPKKALPSVKGFLTSWKGTKAAAEAEKIREKLERAIGD